MITSPHRGLATQASRVRCSPVVGQQAATGADPDHCPRVCSYFCVSPRTPGRRGRIPLPPAATRPQQRHRQPSQFEELRSARRKLSPLRGQRFDLHRARAAIIDHPAHGARHLVAVDRRPDRNRLSKRSSSARPRRRCALTQRRDRRVTSSAIRWPVDVPGLRHLGRHDLVGQRRRRRSAALSCRRFPLNAVHADCDVHARQPGDRGIQPSRGIPRSHTTRSSRSRRINSA